MPICTLPYNRAHGAEIEILLTKPSSIYDPQEVKESQRRLRLLIDTGASKTAISNEHLVWMRLVPYGKRLMRTATSEKEVNLYDVDLTFEMPSSPFVIPNFSVMEFPAGWRDGVLGRDFLEHVVLEINGPEETAKLIF